MSRKNLVYLGSGIGMACGSAFSFSAILLSGVGGILGIIITMKLTS